ncbi:putative RNA polymerase ii- paf1 protein [Rosellinia necatrix]|uniref:Putative RNA polymerase ii-paf1 protein n=1 Tax=Rosellinia necatrix TaxID=77044 RepID=A0A1W2TMP0_ROSNE|nr:putative RNA polymerase ii- paf1 protein [Rosellinia necatrix]
MASSSRGAGEHRPVHQDYIARIRYSNALPPPPNPPKLLDIPNTGLASGQYTAPGFASRLAREQPLNIEADAELGMPLDLIGMPGIFDGDEGSIHAPSQAPSLHSLNPQDRMLLRPLQTLGKPKMADSAVSFLRRTEYISSVSTKGKHDAGALRSLNPTPLKRPTKRRSPEPDKDSPAYVKRKIDQSFSIAAANLKDKSRVRHPMKRNLKLVDSYPMVPDLDAFPDYGGYFTIKFSNNPVPASGTYDKRLLNALVKPGTLPEEIESAYKLAKQAHERDPANNPKPTNPQTYNYFLSDSLETSEKFNQRFDVMNDDYNDDGLYTSKNSDGHGCFQFRFIRTYETKDEIALDNTTKYDEELLIAFNNDDMVDQKAVYYLPVMHRVVVKPQRSRTIHRDVLTDDVEEIPDRLAVTVNDFDDKTRSIMEKWKTDPYKDPFPSEQADGDDGGEKADQQEDTINGEGEATREDSDEDQDAEGDEEE